MILKINGSVEMAIVLKYTTDVMVYLIVQMALMKWTVVSYNYCCMCVHIFVFFVVYIRQHHASMMQELIR